MSDFILRKDINNIKTNEKNATKKLLSLIAKESIQLNNLVSAAVKCKSKVYFRYNSTMLILTL